MFVSETLLPRPVLFNAALYAVVALVYTIAFFALETASPGKYVFATNSDLRTVFSYIAIVSWPILLFGALILIAVRIGAKIRRRRRKREKKSKRAQDAARSARSGPEAALVRHAPPSTLPPGAIPPGAVPPGAIPHDAVPHVPAQPGLVKTVTGELLPHDRSASRSRSRKRSKSRVLRVPRGYVAVSRPQRVFASFGFLWVSVGLACSAAAAVIIFFGQRERYRQETAELGREGESWKAWVIPVFCGILMAIVFAILSVTTLVKFFTTFTTRGREIETPEPSEVDAASENAQDEPFFEPSAPPLTPDLSAAFSEPSPPPAIGRGRTRLPGDPHTRGRRNLPYQPDQKTVDRLMRQLRDMGFANPHENLAALQASSFDLERASEKLTNTRV